MPAITIQQAYALAMRSFINLETPASAVSTPYVAVPGLTSTTKNKLQELLDSVNKDLGRISYTPTGGVLTDLIADAATPSNTTYTLLSTNTNLNGGSIPDYLEGGSIDNTTGTLSTVEKWFHITGLGILKKVKK